MRDLMVLAGLLTLLPLVLNNAFIAVLVWGWTAIIAFNYYTFGFMGEVRLNLIFGLIALLMILFKRDTVRGSSLSSSGSFILLTLFLIQATISALFAYSGNSINWQLHDKLFKTLLFALVLPIVVVGRYRIHAVVVMLCLGLAFHGVIDGLKFVASGGAHLVRGLAKFGDNNLFAVGLAMIIPLLLYLARYSKHRLIRLVFMFGAFLTVAAVIGTRSRGGFISLVAMGLWLLATSRQKLAGIVTFVAGIVFVLVLAPEAWMDRMETIKEAESVNTFITRIEAWQVSSAIALENPLTGGGLHSVQVQSVWTQFKGSKGFLGFIDTGDPSPIFRAAHSIYFEVLGDMGFVGFAIFLGILLNAIINGVRTRKLIIGRESEFEWASDLSNALTAVIITFMVGGLSVSVAYSEVIYVAIMLTEILRREVASAIDAPMPISVVARSQTANLS